MFFYILWIFYSLLAKSFLSWTDVKRYQNKCFKQTQASYKWVIVLKCLTSISYLIHLPMLWIWTTIKLILNYYCLHSQIKKLAPNHTASNKQSLVSLCHAAYCLDNSCKWYSLNKHSLQTGFSLVIGVSNWINPTWIDNHTIY